MKLEPLGERVIVKKIIAEKIGSIFLPEDVKRQSLQGEVIHIGPDCSLVKVGDTILFGRYSGFDLPTLGNYIGCLLMNEADILCKTNKTKGE